MVLSMQFEVNKSWAEGHNLLIYHGSISFPNCGKATSGELRKRRASLSLTPHSTHQNQKEQTRSARLAPNCCALSASFIHAPVKRWGKATACKQAQAPAREQITENLQPQLVWSALADEEHHTTHHFHDPRVMNFARFSFWKLRHLAKSLQTSIAEKSNNAFKSNQFSTHSGAALNDFSFANV